MKSRYQVVIYRDGSVYRYLDDTLHYEKGPAVMYLNDHKRWYLNGLLHREDGPAVEYPDGIREYYLRGIEVSERAFGSRRVAKK